MLAPVAPVFKVYVVAPLEVIVAELPAQIVDGDVVTVRDGIAFMVMVFTTGVLLPPPFDATNVME
jgi:hypothetical protein